MTLSFVPTDKPPSLPDSPHIGEGGGMRNQPCSQPGLAALSPRAAPARAAGCVCSPRKRQTAASFIAKYALCLKTAQWIPSAVSSLVCRNKYTVSHVPKEGLASPASELHSINPRPSRAKSARKKKKSTNLSSLFMELLPWQTLHSSPVTFQDKLNPV